MQRLHRVGEPVATHTGVMFEAASDEGQSHRFIVSAIALDALERAADAPSNWLRVFGAHEARILQAAALALQAEPRAGTQEAPLLLTAAQVCAVPGEQEARGAMPGFEELMAMPPPEDRPAWLQ